MKLFALLTLLALTLAASPAAGQGLDETLAATRALPGEADTPEVMVPLVDLDVAARLRDEARDWDGTRYRYGGDSRAGIDCSALMRRWFSDLFDEALPRTADEQFDRGTSVERAELRPGDLVFFGSRRGINHVGVFVGDGEFAHASRSAGVTVSRLNEAYWKARYRGARRVLGLSGLGQQLPPVETVVAATEVPVRQAAAPTFTRASARGARALPATRRTGW